MNTFVERYGVIIGALVIVGIIVGCLLLGGCQAFDKLFEKPPPPSTLAQAANVLKSKNETKSESETHNDSTVIEVDTTATPVQAPTDNVTATAPRAENPPEVTITVKGRAKVKATQTSTGSSTSTASGSGTESQTQTHSATTPAPAQPPAPPKSPAQQIAGWVVALTVILSLGCLALAVWFAYRLQFLNMGYALGAAAAVIVAGIALSYIAVYWVWFMLGGLVILAGIVIYRYHDLIAVKAAKWLKAGTLDKNAKTLKATARKAVLKKAATLEVKP